jgi:bis(5'-nucleosyl)-tetraphosphatase (symmetrical)
MKYCNHQGKLDFISCGSICTQSKDSVPWYRLSNRLTTQLNIIFADDADFQDDNFPGIYPLPTQAKLTALKLASVPEMISVVRLEQTF